MLYIIIPLIIFLVCLLNIDAILYYFLHSDVLVKAIICFIAVVPIYKFMTRVALRIYVHEVYYHCWRLICHVYKIDYQKGDFSFFDEGDKLYERIKPWISRHNIVYYKECIPIKYETIGNPLFPGHGVETHYGLTPQSMAYHILCDISKDERVTKIPYWVIDKKLTKKKRLNLIMDVFFFSVDYISR